MNTKQRRLGEFYPILLESQVKLLGLLLAIYWVISGVAVAVLSWQMRNRNAIEELQHANAAFYTYSLLLLGFGMFGYWFAANFRYSIARDFGIFLPEALRVRFFAYLLAFVGFTAPAFAPYLSLKMHAASQIREKRDAYIQKLHKGILYFPHVFNENGLNFDLPMLAKGNTHYLPPQHLWGEAYPLPTFNSALEAGQMLERIYAHPDTAAIEGALEVIREANISSMKGITLEQVIRQEHLQQQEGAHAFERSFKVGKIAEEWTNFWLKNKAPQILTLRDIWKYNIVMLLMVGLMQLLKQAPLKFSVQTAALTAVISFAIWIAPPVYIVSGFVLLLLLAPFMIFVMLGRGSLSGAYSENTLVNAGYIIIGSILATLMVAVPLYMGMESLKRQEGLLEALIFTVAVAHLYVFVLGNRWHRHHIKRFARPNPE